jgi:hypothetical protein
LTFDLLKRLFSSFFWIFWTFILRNYHLNWLLKLLSHHFSVIREIRELAEMGEWAKASITKKKFNRELWCRFESEIREWASGLRRR